MAALESRDASYLGRVRRRQRPLAIGGAVLALFAASYLGWALLRFDPRVDPRDDPGFDRPIAQLAFLFQNGQLRLEKLANESTSENEVKLLRLLSRNMAFSAGIMVLQLRLFVGTMGLLGGLIMMTVVVERRRLLQVIQKLEE